jgi:hypothetical protein
MGLAYTYKCNGKVSMFLHCHSTAFGHKNTKEESCLART